jgi:hypothetical protein
MPQLNLYVPEDLAARLKRAAHRARLPLSRYVVSLLETRTEVAGGWPPDYFKKTCGFLRKDFPEIEDRPPEPVEAIEIRR